MRDPHEIIVRPLITEKSTIQAELNKYHFRVRNDANKIEIAQAVEMIYANQQARVVAVNTLRVKGKKRRVTTRTGRGRAGYAPSWKKAIVTTAAPLTLVEGI